MVRPQVHCFIPRPAPEARLQPATHTPGGLKKHGVAVSFRARPQQASPCRTSCIVSLPPFPPSFTWAAPPPASPRHLDLAALELSVVEEAEVLFGLGRHAVVLPCSGLRWSSVPRSSSCRHVRVPAVAWRRSHALRGGWGGKSCGAGELYAAVEEERAAAVHAIFVRLLL